MRPTLAFVGDSVAFGTGDEAGRGGWKGRVCASLAASFTELALDDFAVEGAPTAGVLATRARRISARLQETNAAIRSAAAPVGAAVIDVAAMPEAADPRCWSADNLHPSAFGYDLLATRVLARRRDLSVAAP